MNKSKSNVWKFFTVFTVVMLVSSVFTGMILASDTDNPAFEEVAETPKGTFHLQIEPLLFRAKTSLCSDIDQIFILDCSGSMRTMDAVLPDGTTVSRLDAAKFATKNFIDLLPTGTDTRVGVVSYRSYGGAKVEQILTGDFNAAKCAVDLLTTGGTTSIGEGIEKGIDELQTHGGKNKRVFLLLTDGKANSYPPGWSPPLGWTPPPGSWTTAELYTLYQAHIALTFDLMNPTKTYTVGVGYQSAINENLLQVLASSSSGKYFFAGTTSIQEMFNDIAADICAGDIRVLILANFKRMEDIGYDSASVDNLKTKLQDLADNNPNGRGILVDLNTIASIRTAYTNWNGNEGDIAKTNELVQVIDNYIEDQKQNRYPKLKYVILVGSHEVLPMKARPDDYTFPKKHFWCPEVNEKHWAENSLPQKSGYLYNIYHAGTNGYYLTDTIYSDLSYRDGSADHELTPELCVGRLVETPTQIINVIAAYMNNNGKIPKNHFVSMASIDLLPGGTQAKDDMIASGVPTVGTLVQCAYASAFVPPLLNAKHDIVYFAGHANYNSIVTNGEAITSWWSCSSRKTNDFFAAGNDPDHGDTNELCSIDGAVIIGVGCHFGMNFGNKLYHEPDADTTYSEFPEEFAKKGVVAFVGLTGYGAVEGAECDTNKDLAAYSEKLATNVVHSLVIKGTDIGTAFHEGANDYYKELGTVEDWDRSALAISTLYGIPTYINTFTSNDVISTNSVTGYSAQKASLRNLQSDSEQVTITITNYSVNSTSGLVTIPGTTQAVSFNEPIIPVLFVEKTLPYGSAVSSIIWNETASQFTITDNDVPIAGIACSEVVIEGNFTYDGFYPVKHYTNYSILTLGGGGAKVGIAVNPVQYNSQTNQTKIWTKLVCDIQYDIPDTGISVVDLSTDKYLYYPNENVVVSIGITNSGSTRSVDLSMIMRNANTSEEIATATIGSMGLAGGTISSGTYSINLTDIPQVRGKNIEGELIVLDPNNDNVLGSDSVTFSVKQSIAQPIANANGPYSGVIEYIAVPITFDGTGSYDPDGAIVSYEWDLNDDGIFDDAFGATPTVSFTAPGLGNIHLKVTDNNGATDTDTTTLTITKHSPPPNGIHDGLLMPPEQPQCYSGTSTIQGKGYFSIDESIQDWATAIDTTEHIEGVGEFEMDSKKVLNQAANPLNFYDPNFYYKKTMQFQGNATNRLISRDKFESSGIFGGTGTRINEYFDVSMIQKDESGSIKTISAPGSGQSHRFATMDDFSGIWGIHSDWQKICQKDIVHHQMFIGNFSVQKDLTFEREINMP
jgi:hypothetical protein